MEKDPHIESRQYEIRNDGDVIVLSGEEKKLATTGKRIVEILNRSKERESITNALLQGETIRPAGAFAVYLLMGKLYVDTRNARGEEQYRKQIKDAVEAALAENP